MSPKNVLYRTQVFDSFSEEIRQRAFDLYTRESYGVQPFDLSDDELLLVLVPQGKIGQLAVTPTGQPVSLLGALNIAAGIGKDQRDEHGWYPETVATPPNADAEAAILKEAGYTTYVMGLDKFVKAIQSGEIDTPQALAEVMNVQYAPSQGEVWRGLFPG